MLHIINHDLCESSALKACLARAVPGDVVLFIENAVYEARHLRKPIYDDLADEVAVYVLLEDLLARGLGSEELLPRVQLVDYQGFVALVEQHHPIQSWF